MNNQSVETAILGRFDYLDIGPYTIKIKLLESKHPQPGQPAESGEVKQGQVPEQSGDATIEMEMIEPAHNDESADSEQNLKPEA